MSERLADRPEWSFTAPWGMPIDEQREAEVIYKREFKEFVFSDLSLRLAASGSRNANAIFGSIDGPRPTDQRQKPWHVRALDPVELAAQAVPLIRDIFEDYWDHLYRGHDPSAEDMAAEFGGVSRRELDQRLKKAKERRVNLK